MEQQRFEDTSMNFVHAQLKFRLSEQVLNVATVAITGLGTAAVLFVAVGSGHLRRANGRVAMGLRQLHAGAVPDDERDHVRVRPVPGRRRRRRSRVPGARRDARHHGALRTPSASRRSIARYPLPRRPPALRQRTRGPPRRGHRGARKARRSRSSARPAPARRRCSTSSRASTT